jgi:hypothetical protein
MTGSALRRLTFDQPVTPLAVWAQTLAKAAVVVALLALAASHVRGPLAGFVAVLTLSAERTPSPGLGLFLFLVALAIAAAAVLTALAAMAAIWRHGWRGARQIVSTFLLLALFAPYPAWLVYSAGFPPFLADISTDSQDPPVFSPDLVARRGWLPPPFDAGRAQAQVDAYPDVQPIMVDLETDEAFNAARDAAKQLRWIVLDEIRPGGAARPEGRIEALTWSLALHIPIAITIRVRPADDQTRVDMRVATRFLPNDLGIGATLIGKMNDELEDKDSEE